MPPILFVDTAFWIALRKPRDPLYANTIRWQRYIVARRLRLVTTEMVFWEFLNALSHPTTRLAASTSYLRARREPTLEIVPAQPPVTERALELYASRPDKEWSLTDTLSFLVMRDRNLTDALTADHHFQQAGFTPLLLQAPPAA